VQETNEFTLSESLGETGAEYEIARFVLVGFPPSDGCACEKKHLASF